MGQFNLHVYETSVQTVPQHNFIVLWDMKCLHSWFHKAWTQRCGKKAVWKSLDVRLLFMLTAFH